VIGDARPHAPDRLLGSLDLIWRNMTIGPPRPQEEQYHIRACITGYETASGGKARKVQSRGLAARIACAKSLAPPLNLNVLRWKPGYLPRSPTVPARIPDERADLFWSSRERSFLCMQKRFSRAPRLSVTCRSTRGVSGQRGLQLGRIDGDDLPSPAHDPDSRQGDRRGDTPIGGTHPGKAALCVGEVERRVAPTDHGWR
jgi:hypothetical protein